VVVDTVQPVGYGWFSTVKEVTVSRLDGRTVFITGGARGQGRSHALTLAAEGANVVMMDNLQVDVPYQDYPGGSADEYEHTQRALTELGARYVACVGDVRSPEDLADAVGKAVSEFGAVDVAVCNAGVALDLAPVHQTPVQSWSMTLDINLTGVFNTIQAVLPDMMARRSGRIIATSSMAGRSGYANGVAYGASKWGVIGLIKTVANEYGSYGITANAVCPTNVNSPMIHRDNVYRLFAPDIDNPTREQAEERMKAMHPLGVPYVEPRDISQAILFLASDAARYISGEALTVSAGLAAMNTA
jgi:SDR family mycofactocin-dependent oxidoreductase